MPWLVVMVGAGKYTRFGDHVPQIRAVEAIAHLDHAFKVDVALHHHARRVDFEDLQPAHLVGQRNLNLAIQPAGTQQSRVQRVGTIRRHDDLGLAEVVEAVQLVEQLHERPLDLPVGTSALGEATAADGVDLVHEDDAGLVLLGVAKHLADQSGGLANVFVDDCGRDNCQRKGKALVMTK